MMGALGGPGLNTRLFDAARRYVGEGVSLEHVRVADLPAFVPCADVPDSVVSFRERVAELDGVLVLVTQHLNGVTGSLKNALDWLSSPSSALERKPVAIAGLACDNGSTFAGLQQVRSALTPLGAIVMRQPEYQLVVTAHHFGEADTIVDVELADELANFLTAARGFVAHELRASEVETTPLPVSAGAPRLGAASAGAPLVGARVGVTSSVPSMGARTAGVPVAPLGAGDNGMVANPRRFRA